MKTGNEREYVTVPVPYGLAPSYIYTARMRTAPQAGQHILTEFFGPASR